MSLETDVQALTTAVNDLITAVSLKKSELDAAEAEAAQSAVNALAAQTDAETALAEFERRYLGAMASDPAVDNEGNPLLVGAIYYNTTTTGLRGWNGVTWDSFSVTEAVAAKDAAETAQGHAETAQGLAEGARDAAVTAQGLAETAQGLAEGARDAAVTAQGGAVTAQGLAETARDLAQTAYSDLDIRYLGPKASDPALDNSGGALVEGTLYYNTTSNDMMVYNGAAWEVSYASLSGALLPSNNLSDVSDPAASRANLGLQIGTDIQAYSAVLAGTQESFTTLLKNKLDGVANGANNYVHPSDGVDLGAALTGAIVISDVNVNAAGHVTGFATRALAPADIGAAGSGHDHSGVYQPLDAVLTNTTASFTTTLETKLGTIAENAEVNPDVVSQAEAEAGVATTERTWTAERVKQAIDALATGGVTNPTFISGLTTANNATDAQHDIDVATGICMDSDGDTVIELGSALTKQLDATWASGNNAGGRSSSVSLTAHTWYHVFVVLIGGSVDILFDTSVSCANGVADHSVTQYRRIGSVKTDASANILGYRQKGGHFEFLVYTDEFNGAYTDAAENTLTLATSPPGVEVMPLAVLSNRGYTYSYIGCSHPDETCSYRTPHTASTYYWGASHKVDCFTNTSSQIKWKMTAVGPLYAIIYSYGWIDPRGEY